MINDSNEVFSVYEGFGGQKLQERSLKKLTTLRDWSEKTNMKLGIIIDGGVNESTASQVKKAGANILVAGSYLFKGSDLKERSKLLLDL